MTNKLFQNPSPLPLRTCWGAAAASLDVAPPLHRWALCHCHPPWLVFPGSEQTPPQPHRDADAPTRQGGALEGKTCKQRWIRIHTHAQETICVIRMVSQGKHCMCCALSSFSFTELRAAYHLLIPDIYTGEENTHLTPACITTSVGFSCLSFGFLLEIKLTFPVHFSRQFVRINITLLSRTNPLTAVTSELWDIIKPTHWHRFPTSVWNPAEFDLQLKSRSALCVCLY